MESLKSAKARITEAVELIGRAMTFEKLSTIERDIILAKLAKAYEMVLASEVAQNGILSTNNAEIKPDNRVNVETIVEVESQPDPIVLIKPSAEITVDSPVEAPKTIKDKTEFIASSPSTDLHKSEENSSVQGEILAEKFQGKQKFRNEIIAEHTAKVDMSSKLQNKPIGDLAKAIGINDKFLFIKELFDGDAARYSEAIQHLNLFSDLNDAVIFLQDNYQWSENNEYATKFIDLVRRKFI